MRFPSRCEKNLITFYVKCTTCKTFRGFFVYQTFFALNVIFKTATFNTLKEKLSEKHRWEKFRTFWTHKKL